MTKKTWALKLVGRHTLDDKKLGPIINFPRTVKLLQSEHARAVRIVQRLQKNAERGGFGLAYGVALKDVLAALTKGRA